MGHAALLQLGQQVSLAALGRGAQGLEDEAALLLLAAQLIGAAEVGLVGHQHDERGAAFAANVVKHDIVDLCAASGRLGLLSWASQRQATASNASSSAASARLQRCRRSIVK